LRILYDETTAQQNVGRRGRHPHQAHGYAPSGWRISSYCFLLSWVRLVVIGASSESKTTLHMKIVAEDFDILDIFNYYVEQLN